MRNPLLLSLLSVVMLCSGWLGFSGVPLLAAFVPLLLISDSYDKGRRNFWKMFGWTVLTFGLWGVITLWWIWYATWLGPVSSISVMMFFFGGIFMFYHWISKRVPAPLAYTILVTAWISFEYAYLNGQISFPWLNLGNGFANDVKLVQWYDTTGAFGGALWVWLCNLLIFNALKSRSGRYWIAPAVVVFVPMIISVVKYYTYKEVSNGTVTVTSVQPNIDPYIEKFYLPQEAQTEILLKLCAEAPADVDYILLPETAIHDGIWENTINYNPVILQFRDFLRGRYPQAQIIIGADSKRRYEPGERIPETARTRDYIDFWYDSYNTAFAIDTTGVAHTHHKYKLVIGAERKPFPKLLKSLDLFIVDLGGTVGQLGFDSVRTVFTHRGDLTAAAGICYESIYGEYMAEFVQKGAQVLFIITNDGWWEDTPGYKQHFSFSRLRTIETRRSLGRSANTGISGFINQRGDVMQKTGWDERLTITAELPLSNKITFYVKYGDYIARLCVYVLGLCLLYCVAYAVRRKTMSVNKPPQP